jgi:hypothetical protein
MKGFVELSFSKNQMIFKKMSVNQSTGFSHPLTKASHKEALIEDLFWQAELLFLI